MKNKFLLNKFRGKLSTIMFALFSPVWTIAQSPDCQNYGNGSAENITYSVNGNSVGSLAGNVSSGDTLQVCFTLNAGCDPTIFSLVSYSAPGPTFDANTAYLQTVYDMDSHTFFGSGTFCLTVKIPDCYFQVDFVKGCVIYQLGPGNFYSTGGRLIAGANGGNGTCNCVASANAGADVSLTCNSTSATLNGSTFVHNPIISWQASNGGTITSGGNTLHPTVTTSGTYILLITDTLGCIAKDSVSVTGHINVLTPGIIGYDQVNCGPFKPDCLVSVSDATAHPGETIQYQWLYSHVNTPNTYGNPYWHAIPGATSPGYCPDSIFVSTYYIRCARTVGCTFVGNTTEGNIVSVIVLDQVNVNLGNDTTICAGASVTLNAENSGMSYSWSTGETTQTIVVNITGTYTVTVTDGNCSSSDEIHVTILPYPIVNLGNDISICASSVILNAGNQGMNYNWNTGETTQSITVTVSGTYSVIVSNGDCTASDVINVTLAPSLTVDLGNDTTATFCTGNITLDAANSGMNYIWNTGATTQTIAVNTSGTYYVDVTNQSGCMASDTIQVTIIPGTLNVDLGHDTVLCAGGSITLDAGNSGMSFMWSTGATTQTIMVNASGTYSVTVTDGNCTASDIINVTILPVLTVDLGNDTTVVFCVGTLTLDAGISGMVYLWNTGATTQTINVSVSGTYYVDVTNSADCLSSDTINVTVNPGTLTVDLGNDTVMVNCKNDSFLLDAGAGAYYAWSTGQTTQTIYVSTTGIYSVTVTGSNGCVASDTIHVVLYGNLNLNLGPDTAVCGCFFLNAYISGATSYQWCGGSNYPYVNVCTTGVYCVTVTNGICTVSDTIHITVNQPPVVNLGKDTTVMTNLILNAGNTGALFLWNTGATTQTLFVTSSGQYYVIVTDPNGCIDSDTINVSVISGISEITNADFNVNVYPNPSNDNDFTLNFNIAESGNVEIRIMNTLGLVIYSEKLENFKGEYHKKITIEKPTAGIYIADILKGNTRNTIKIALE